MPEKNRKEDMKLIVVYRDGRQREIDVPPDATVALGEGLNRLTNGCIEHWFDRDGYYDGWGAMINQRHCGRSNRATSTEGAPMTPQSSELRF